MHTPCGMTESTLRSFSSSGRGVDLIPLGDKRELEEGGVWGGNRAKNDPGGAEFRAILEGKNELNTNVFDDFHKKHQKLLSAGGQKASAFEVFGLKNTISS